MKPNSQWVQVCLIGLLCVVGMGAQEPRPVVGEPEAPGRQLPDGTVPEATVRLIKFSGVMQGPLGEALSGVLGVTFALYKNQQDSVPLWLETQNVSLDEEGHYSVLLGATKSKGLPLDIFASGEARWLGIQVQGEPEKPRVLLGSVPYALKAEEAEKLAGRSATEFVLAEELRSPEGREKLGLGSTSEPPGAAAAPPAVRGTGTPNIVAKFTGTTTIGDSSIFDMGGKVGIGTTTPPQELSVIGDGDFSGGVRIHEGNPQGFMLGMVTGNPSSSAFALWEVAVPGQQWIAGLERTGASYDFVIHRNGGPHVFAIDIDTNKVGIGTTTPSSELSVVGGGDFSGTLSAGALESQGNIQLFNPPPPGGFRQLRFVGFGGTNNMSLYFDGQNGVVQTDPGSFNPLIFRTDGLDRMYITPQGDVGIGTVLPGSKLEVAGEIRAQEKIQVFGDAGFRIENTPGSGQVLLAVFPNTKALALSASPDNDIQILPSGNVGIGTVTPTEKLEVAGNLKVSGDLIVTGTKSSVAELPDGRTALLYAVESPENWFEDFGSAQLREGVAWVELEATFAQTINTELNYHVFLTPTGDCRGLFVGKKTPGGFEVRELGGGRSNVSFDYRIVARRRGFEEARLQGVAATAASQGAQLAIR